MESRTANYRLKPPKKMKKSRSNEKQQNKFIIQKEEVSLEEQEENEQSFAMVPRQKIIELEEEEKFVNGKKVFELEGKLIGGGTSKDSSTFWAFSSSHLQLYHNPSQQVKATWHFPSLRVIYFTLFRNNFCSPVYIDILIQYPNMNRLNARRCSR